MTISSLSQCRIPRFTPTVAQMLPEASMPAKRNLLTAAPLARSVQALLPHVHALGGPLDVAPGVEPHGNKVPVAGGCVTFFGGLTQERT